MASTTLKKERPLHIRFASYGADDDPEFKYELVVLMSGSLRELRQAAALSLASGGSDLFKRAAHKAKSTLTLIDDTEFNDAVETFTTSVAAIEKETRDRAFEQFNTISESIIESLDREADNLKQQLG